MVHFSLVHRTSSDSIERNICVCIKKRRIKGKTNVFFFFFCLSVCLFSLGALNTQLYHYICLECTLI